MVNTKNDLAEKEVQVDQAGNQVNPSSVEKQQELIDKIPTDTRSGSLPTIDTAHHELHDGKHFTFCEILTGLGNNTVTDYLITVGTKGAHLIWNFEADLAAQIEFYEAPTASGGSAQNIMNNNRFSANVAESAIAKAPTVTGVGTKLCQHRSGTATGPSKVGGTSRSENEWILKNATKYLFRVTSLAASNNASFDLAFYEL